MKHAWYTCAREAIITLVPGDVFYACNELIAWLGQPCRLIAAVSVGYPEESPAARPRKAPDEVARWP